MPPLRLRILSLSLFLFSHTYPGLHNQVRRRNATHDARQERPDPAAQGRY